jgi:outer membrane protein assembly factor BamB
VIDANGTVYAAFGKLVYALNPTTGAEIWPEPFRLGGDAISLAVGDGVLYVTAKDYKLYALVNK